MGSHLNLIGSIVIGALLLMAIINMNASMTSKSYENTLDNIVRHNITSLSEFLCGEFRRIGYGVGNPSIAISSFDSTSIRFLSDIDSDGVVDTLIYYLSDPAYASNTPNPRDRYLIRQINGGTLTQLGLGVTDFKLRYFDNTGNITFNAASINSIEIRLTMESIAPCSVEDSIYYAQNFWQTKITPPNLLR